MTEAHKPIPGVASLRPVLRDLPKLPDYLSRNSWTTCPGTSGRFPPDYVDDFAGIRTYCGSRDSDVFHRAWCRLTANIAPENLIAFVSREGAIECGYRPCKVCEP